MGKNYGCCRIDDDGNGSGGDSASSGISGGGSTSSDDASSSGDCDCGGNLSGRKVACRGCVFV
jgi:hypothetical protein